MSRGGVSPMALLAGMNDRRGILIEDRQWQVEDEWPSFSAHFWRLRSGDERIALKLGSNWTGETVAYLAGENDRVSAVLGAVSSRSIVMPAVLGISVDPPALALEYRPGVRLFSVLSELDSTERDSLVSASGAGIGAFHASDPPPGDPEATAAALDELRRAARRAGVSWVRVSAVEPGLVRARGYRFSPNDFLVAPHGDLVFLDPPHVRKYDYVHRDLASFLMELHRSLAGEGRPSPAARGVVEQVSARFLHGYRETGPSTLETEADAWVMDLFQSARISGIFQTRLRTLRPISAYRALSWWRWSRPG